MKAVEIANVGSGAFGDVDGWTVNEAVTSVVASDMSTNIGDMTLNVQRTADTELAVGNNITIDHPLLGKTKARVNTVRPNTPGRATLTADSALDVFLSGRSDIPGIESGLPLAALDVAAQAAGFRRQTSVNADDNYWSLAGHAVGFTPAGEIVQPSAVDLTLANPSILGGSLVTEPVLYQQITGFCAIANFNAAGLPTSIVGDTPQLGAQKTLIKFTMEAPVNSTGSTFEVNFGPTYRTFDLSQAANQTRIRVLLNPAENQGQINVAIRTSSATGLASNQSQTINSPALRYGLPTVVSLELSMSDAREIMVRCQVANADTSASLDVVGPPLPGNRGIFYPKQWTLIQNSTGPGFRDLVTRYTGAQNALEAFAGRNYAAPAAVISQLTSQHAGSPIAGFNGELWEYVKQVAAARRFEVTATANGIVAREPRVVSIEPEDRASAAVTISDASQARNVVVTNMNTRVLGIGSEAWRADTLYTIDVRETKEVVIRLPEGVRFVYSPRPWYYSKAVNGISLPGWNYLDDAAALEAGTVGRYFVMARDGFPVNPLQWTQYGGRLFASIVDGVAKLTLIGPTREIPGVTGPFRIGESAGGSSDFAVLRLLGVGVTSSPTPVRLPSGADFKRTRVDASATITNVAIGQMSEVYNAAAWVAQRVAGPTITLSMVLPYPSLPGFGLIAGAVIRWSNNLFRVETATISGGVATITATRLTGLMDFPVPNRTIASFEADNAGLSCGDFSIRSLLPPTL